MIEGVWVISVETVLPVATMLRQGLVDVSLAKNATVGQKDKMELVYDYLTGTGFRLRVESIVEAFQTLAEDQEKEERAMLRQWAKRRTLTARALTSTVGLYGDLQGIAGKSITEIASLELPALTTGEDDD